MPPGKSFRGRGEWPAAALPALACGLALALAAAVAATPALAIASRLGEGVLSPRLAELAKPAVRSLPPARQARALSLARSGPGSLLRHGNRVLVESRFEGGMAGKAGALRAAGAEIVNVSGRYRTITVAAKPADLPALARVGGVIGVKEVLKPILSAASACPSGVTVSEGDIQMGAAEARSGFGVNGSGVTVGILSDSFNQATQAVDGSEPITTRAAEDVASGDLPGVGNPCGQTTPVNVLENDLFEPEKEEPTDEGRAMAQIVHDLAPGANLAFASADNGPEQFAANIKRLAKPVSEGGAGAKVIADDVTYLDEPFFQDGPIAGAINEVASHGVDYFTAAGNDNLIEEGTGNEIGSWEAPEFRNPGTCPSGVPVYASHCMDFNPGSTTDRGFEITVEPEATVVVDLQWAQPWFGVTTDLDAYLLEGGIRVAESESPNTDPGLQEPVEVLGWTNPSSSKAATVELAINRCEAICGVARAAAHPEELGGTGGGDTGTPRLKFILTEDGGGVSKTEYSTSSGGDTVGPTIFGHAGAASAISTGAIRFNTTSEPEFYSSRGPATHYFGPVSGTTPAAPLITPQVISKPDLVATDGGATTFFGSCVSRVWRFFGTSAAAPHAAAVAALELQAKPAATAEEIRMSQIETASEVGAFPPEAVGAGLVQAPAAIAYLRGEAFPGGTASSPANPQNCHLPKPPVITITERPPAIGRNPSPSIGFTANHPVSFSCSVDAAAAQPCTSPFRPAIPLPDGKHSFVVSGTDAEGLTGTSETVSFTIDTTPPLAFFRHHPHKVIRTRRPRIRAAFRFGSNEEGVTFSCQVDRGPSRTCTRGLSRSFRAGRHVVRVLATDAAGNVSAKPAVFRFRVERVG